MQKVATTQTIWWFIRLVNKGQVKLGCVGCCTWSDAAHQLKTMSEFTYNGTWVGVLAYFPDDGCFS